MLKKCLLLLLLLCAVSSVNADAIDYIINETDYAGQDDVLIDGNPYHVFAIIENPGVYNVTADFVNDSLTTYNIVILVRNTENVTLNCNDMWINSTALTSPNYPIYVYNSTNVTIKDLKSEWIDDGIVFNNVNNSVIMDSELTIGACPIWVTAYSSAVTTHGNEFLNNNITFSDHYSDNCGIVFGTDSVNDTVSGNIFTGPIGCGEAIVFEEDVTGANVSDNAILTSGVNGGAIYFSNNRNVDSITIENNVISTSGSGTPGIYFVGNVSNTEIVGNDITTNLDDGAGIHIDQYSTNNTILNNNIRTYGIDASAIELQHLSTNDLILNNIISTITGYGISINGGLNLVTIENNDITSGGSAISFDGDIFNSEILSNTLTYIFIENGENNTILNNTMNNVEVYGNGYTISSNTIDDYIEVYGNNSEISSNNVYSIYVEGSNATISENTVGDYIEVDGNNTVVSSNNVEIYIDVDWNNTVVSSNTVGEYIDIDGSNATISENTVEDYIYVYGDNSTISENTVLNGTVESWAGHQQIRVYGNYNIISSNNLTGLDDLWYIMDIEGSHNTISENTVYSEIYAYGVYNTISSNTIINSGDWAIDFDGNEGVAYATVFNNTVYASEYGICLDDCGEDYSNISYNTVYASEYPIYIESGVDGCNIYLNNFIYTGELFNKSELNATIAENNSFISPFEIEYTYRGTTYSNFLGNYWSDYDGIDADGNGIGDTPYLYLGDYSTGEGEYYYLEYDTAPLIDMWNSGEIGNYVAPTTTRRSSGGSGSAYDSDIADDIESKSIKSFVSSATVVYGNDIDEAYAKQLRERVHAYNDSYAYSGNIIIVGGPSVNKLAKKYNDQFEIPITNEVPGENKGIIQILKVQDNSGKVITSYTIVYVAGSDRLGTLAAMEYFKTLDEIPTGPIIVEWTENGPVLVE